MARHSIRYLMMASSALSALPAAAAAQTSALQLDEIIGTTQKRAKSGARLLLVQASCSADRPKQEDPPTTFVR